MARPLRLEFPGALYHVTVRGNEKRNIFRDDFDRHHFLELLGDCVDRFRWILSSYALMPNHFHLMVQLTIETLSDGMHWLNGCYSQDFNRRHKRVGHLFQGRFKAILVEKETYHLELSRYVVLNPVRAGIVARPEDDSWTSYRAIAGIAAAPNWLAVDDILTQFGPTRDIARDNYRQFVDAGIGLERKPWDDLVGQMYLGSERWLDRVRAEIALKSRADEHPRIQRILPGSPMASVVSGVATTFGIEEDLLRKPRGGLLRNVAAWIGCYEALLTNAEVAAGLRVRSSGHVTKMVLDCERQLAQSNALRMWVNDCISTIGRAKRESKT